MLRESSRFILRAVNLTHNITLPVINKKIFSFVSYNNIISQNKQKSNFMIKRILRWSKWWDSNSRPFGSRGFADRGLKPLGYIHIFFLKNLTAYTSLQWWVLPSYEVAGFLVCSSLLQTLVQRERLATAPCTSASSPIKVLQCRHCHNPKAIPLFRSI